jgi:hypothetical protein
VPIFSNRSILMMLDQVSGVIGEIRYKDLIARLRMHTEASVAAEWEIAVLYCLSQQGSIRSCPSTEGQSEIDIIFKGRNSSEEVAVEVTALSDRSLHERNPIHEFNGRVTKEFIKYGLHKLGATHTGIGSSRGPEGPILAIPDRKDFGQFFSSTSFKAFLSAIRSEPTKDHSYEFGVRGSTSRIRFAPGKNNSGASYASHTVIKNVFNNHLARRLESKNRQLKKSGMNLPAIVVVCDADCNVLSTRMRGFDTVTADDIADMFLSGRRHIQKGPWLIQKGAAARSRRINAVHLWSLHEEWNTWKRGPEARSAKVTIVPNRGNAAHEMSSEVCMEVAQSSRYLPPIVSMPFGALRVLRRPSFYGGYEMSGGQSGFKVKISLLTLQRLLSGEISADEFRKDHEELSSIIKAQADEGRMISKMEISHQANFDDDWVEITFGGQDPTKLFKAPTQI